MASDAHYSPVMGGHDVQDSEEFEFHDVTTRPSEEVEQEGTWLSSISSASELDMNTQDTSYNTEPPLEFRALTLLDNAPDAKTRPEWQDPVRWCLWGNTVVLVINIALTIVAVVLSASKHGGLGFGPISLYQGSRSTTQNIRISLHLLINVLGVTMTATSNYCCAILMAPSRTDVDKAHSKGTWLSIGVPSWRNFRNLGNSRQVLWSLLFLTSIIMQMVYNSIVYSSLNANSYPVLVAPLEFVSNSSEPASFFEEKSCWPEDVIAWNMSELRSSIINGAFEYLSNDKCIEAYASSYVSDRRTVITVTRDNLTIEGISLAGYGYAGGISATNPTTTKFGHNNPFSNFGDWDPLGFEWMCYGNNPSSSGCSSEFVRGLRSWDVAYANWSLQTSVDIPKANQSWISRLWLLETGESNAERALLETNLTWTRKDVEDFLSYVQSNPLPDEIRAFLNNTSWIASAGPGVSVSASCPDMDRMQEYRIFTGLHATRVDHCLSQKTAEEYRLYYHLPIALAIIICNLVKVVCIWLLLRVNRNNLFLTIGDAISSFLQQPDPSTEQWCTLSPEVITGNEKCPWHPRNRRPEKGYIWPQEPHPGLFPTNNEFWGVASSRKIWWMTILVLLLFTIICLVLPVYAVENPVTHQYGGGGFAGLSGGIWQIKGWGTIQSTALLSSFAASFVGMELLANTPQLLVSFLYFCFNHTLTRMILAADYNNFAIRRRPLRVSFPRGEQRSTWYLTIPYQYSISLLTTFTLIHWFISEGLFYVQILPYGLDGQPMFSDLLVTCCVSTIPLELGLFLTIGVLLIISILSYRKFKAAKMPIACEWSVAISAACHPPRLDLDAAFKPVQWGEVENDAAASYPHCSFTSKRVKEPKKDVQYA